MNNFKKTKQYKIKDLISISEGKANISSLLPEKYKVWRLLKDGLYHDFSGLALNEQRLHSRNDPGTTKILVVRTTQEKLNLNADF